MRVILRREKEITDTLRGKATITVDAELNGKVWRIRTEYWKDEDGKIISKKYPMIVVKK